MDQLKSLAAGLLDTLKELQIPAALAGGLAANAWVQGSDVAVTFDVDVAVLLPEEGAFSAESFATRLSEVVGIECFPGSDFELPKARIIRFVCRSLPDEIVGDLVVADRLYAREALARAGSMRIGDRKHAVLAPEDSILFKGLARRPKDLGPIAAIARAQKLDMRYIEKWARKLGIWGFVSRALRG